ncbi:S26 family signal peptidase [Neomesorhizobium albiziae]|uniref:S26 family signal peptidase n=1 Tax=Neomesorhizobium albiziae TaxID=335020 RepID=UPI001FCEC91B|nr:S26 family signal peptidase [Mesorhizobium albiziae]
MASRFDVGTAVMTDGRLLAHSEVHRTDAESRALVPFAGRIVPAGKLFLHSDYPGSYDSRYFGPAPAPASGVLGLAVPVLTFEP